jgi:hypothetical protein
MTKTTKVLLILAIVSLVVGFALNSGMIGVMGIDALYVVFPVGATFAGLFLISKLLEKEAAHYDQEHGAAHGEHGAKEDLGTRSELKNEATRHG